MSLREKGLRKTRTESDLASLERTDNLPWPAPVSVLLPTPPDEPPFFLAVSEFPDLRHSPGSVVQGQAAADTQDDALRRSFYEAVERRLFAEALEDEFLPWSRLDETTEQYESSNLPARVYLTAANDEPPANPVPLGGSQSNKGLGSYPSAASSRDGWRSAWIRERNTTGTAVGRTRNDALLHAILESVERHAFMSFYLGRSSAKQLVPTHPELDQLSASLDRYRLQASWLRLASPIRDVVVVLALLFDHSPMGPSVTAGLAAGFDVAALMRTALFEAWQPRTWLRANFSERALNAAPGSITTPLDRGLFWWSPTKGAALRDWIDSNVESDHPGWNLTSSSSKTAIELAVELRGAKHETYFSTLWESTGIFACRTQTPTLLPFYLHESFNYRDQGEPNSLATMFPHFFL